MTSLPAIPPKEPGAFRILHLSDIHTGLVDWQWKYLLDKRFFGRLNQFVTRQRHLALGNLSFLAENYSTWQVDMALCTGDLTSIGSAEEFQHAEDLLSPLLQAAGKDFLYVPGNHDAYIAQNRAALTKAFQRLNGGRLELDALPQPIVFGPVEFVPLNPARPCAIWLSTGALTPDNWKKLDYILSQPARARVRLVATHFPLNGLDNHPLSWRTKFVNWEHLEELGKRGAFQGVLTGHVHRPFLLSPETASFWRIGAGSLTICNSFALIDIDGTTGAISPKIIHLDTL